MEVIGTAANVIAVVDTSIKVTSLCFQYAKHVEPAATDIERLRKAVTNLQNVAEEAQELLKKPHGENLDKSQLNTDLDDSLSKLKTLELILTPRTSRKVVRKLGRHAVKWPLQSKDVVDWIENLERHAEAINRTLQVEQSRVLLSNDQISTLDRLPRASDASFDFSAEGKYLTCLQNTRVNLLRQIHDWAKDPNAKGIFWLNGMAGTGKSTVSRTTTRDFARSGHLSASFFFKRGDIDRGNWYKFFTTIAAQLVERIPALAPHIKAAVDSHTDIDGTMAQDQFNNIIIQPLRNLPPGARRSVALVLVIDALDECDQDEDIGLIISLFSCNAYGKSLKLKVFVTSRPELLIRLGFSAVEGSYQDFVLYEIPHDVVERDISTFLRSELAVIRIDYNQSVSENRRLPPDWPGEGNIQVLTKMATPLFVFASTVCRFLADRRGGRGPIEKLQDVLQLQSRSQMSKLDKIYLPVLDNFIMDLHGEEKRSALQQFRVIVGSIVILSSPLSTAALGKILNMPKSTIDDQLDLLHSVLDIPLSDESPVRLFHLSFRDFLVDPEKRGKHLFWIDEKQTHEHLAVHCIRIMNEQLRADICKLVQPGTERAPIPSKVINDHITAELHYACLYWASHVQQAGNLMDDNGQVYMFLMQHLLHWLEVLSLIGRASESLNIIKMLQSILKPNESKKVLAFLQEIKRFLLVNIRLIDTTPLQIYSSALAFTPKSSAIRQQFFKDDQIPRWILLAPEPDNNWDQCPQVLESHTSRVTSVAFSPRGDTVVSVSIDNMVQLWRVSDGKCVQELRGHTGAVRSAAVSPQGDIVASASGDNTVRLWQVSDGTLVQMLKGHTLLVSSLVFSPQGDVKASASDDNTVRLWQVSDGKYVKELEGHILLVTSVAFSPQGDIVASASDDNTIRLWQVSDGKCVQELKGHTRWVRSVTFSPQGDIVASASDDNTVRLWQVSDGKCVQELKGHTRWVRSVTFSPRGDIVASASADITVRLWQVSDGKCVQELTHERWISSVAFSPQGDIVALPSEDNRVWARFWQVSGGKCVQEFEGHTRSVNFVAFSPQGDIIASASDNNTVRLWRVSNGKCFQRITGVIGSSIRFHPSDPFLLTEAGSIPIQVNTSTHDRTAIPFTDCVSGLGISEDRCWICWYGKPLFWLPATFRPRCSAILGSSVVIGCSSGRVIIMKFQPTV